MMETSDIINIFITRFDFLKELGFTDMQIYTSDSYTVALVSKNNENGLKYSLGYCEHKKFNPIGSDSDMIFLILFNNKGKHIDFSRLFKKDGFYIENCWAQYFMLKEDDLSPFLTKIIDVIKNNYIKLFTGDDWIEIDYNLRDDY